jgi:hypothetical protein
MCVFTYYRGRRRSPLRFPKPVGRRPELVIWLTVSSMTSRPASTSAPQCWDTESEQNINVLSCSSVPPTRATSHHTPCCWCVAVHKCHLKRGRALVATASKINGFHVHAHDVRSSALAEQSDRPGSDVFRHGQTPRSHAEHRAPACPTSCCSSSFDRTSCEGASPKRAPRQLAASSRSAQGDRGLQVPAGARGEEVWRH